MSSKHCKITFRMTARSTKSFTEQSAHAENICYRLVQILHKFAIIRGRIRLPVEGAKASKPCYPKRGNTGAAPQ